VPGKKLNFSLAGLNAGLNAEPFYLGRVLGIPILAHYSWLPVFPLYAWVISSMLLPIKVPGRPVWEYWTLGVLTASLLFASVLGHELAHSLMARAEGIGTGSITLYLFGGLASLGGQPAVPSSEFKIAVVGPAASFLIGGVFFGLDYLLFHNTTYLAPSQVFRHLGIVNWILAGFNILPGLPLDGGRVLRAIIWRMNRNYALATRTAVRAGMTISLALLLYGAYTVFSDVIIGFWCLIIGLLLATMLLSSRRKGAGGRAPAPGTVEEVMTHEVVTVAPGINVQEFIDTVLRNNRFTSFPVALEGRLHGLILLKELKEIPPDKWPELTAREVMRPVDQSMFIPARTPVAQARSMLERNGIGRAAVVDSSGLLVGYLTVTDMDRKTKAK
jgi:Zn-dependent protease